MMYYMEKLKMEKEGARSRRKRAGERRRAPRASAHRPPPQWRQQKSIKAEPRKTFRPPHMTSNLTFLPPATPFRIPPFSLPPLAFSLQPLAFSLQPLAFPRALRPFNQL